MPMPEEVREVWQNVIKSTKERNASFVYCYNQLKLNTRWGPLSDKQIEEYKRG